MLNYIIEPLQNNTVDELSLKSFYESNIQMFANPDQFLFEEWIFNSEFERSKLVELLEADNFFKPDFKYKKTTNNWLPRSYVSFEKISDYLGSEKAQLLTEVEENNFILFSDYQRQDFSVYFLIDKISKPPRAFQEIKDIVMIDTIIESNCIKFTKKYELNINLKCKMMYSEKEGYIACLKSEVGNISKLLFCIHCSTFGNL